MRRRARVQFAVCDVPARVPGRRADAVGELAVIIVGCAGSHRRGCVVVSVGE